MASDTELGGGIANRVKRHKIILLQKSTKKNRSHQTDGSFSFSHEEQTILFYASLIVIREQLMGKGRGRSVILHQIQCPLSRNSAGNVFYPSKRETRDS